jgi:hypothetical protein
MADQFESFLEQYQLWLHDSADHFVEIMQREMTGIYQTIAHDPEAVRDWEDFLALVDSRAPFSTKYERYQQLKRAACGLPSGALN